MRAVAISLAVLFAAMCMVDARPKGHKRHHHGDDDYKDDQVNPCNFMVCPKGSECTFNSSLADPICVCIRECKPHQRPVCGSDGVLYDNHCELHRAACVKRTRIAVVPDAVCEKPTTAPELIGGNPEVFGDQKPDTHDEIVDQHIDETIEDEEDDAAAADDDADDDEKDDPEVDEEEPEVAEEKPEVVENDTEMVEEEPVVDTEKPVLEEIPTEVVCSEEGLAEFKTNLLDHYRTQFNNPRDDPVLPELDKKFLVSLMTNHFDSSRDSLLTGDEISSVISRDNIEGLSAQCSLLDVLRIYDKNGDKKLDPYEMYDAFDVQIVTISEDLRQQVKVATAGDNVVLVCRIEVEDKSNVIWQRNGVDLIDVQLMDGMKTYDDGTLYFNKLTLMHMGIYTCYVEGYRSVKQTYTVEVRVPPSVHTCPQSRFQSKGKTAKVQCYAQGVPEPEKLWSKKGLTLSDRPGLRLEDCNTTVCIESLDYPDTGKYLCRASNPVGSVQSVSSVFIQENTKALDLGPMHVYYLFHSDGVRVIEPDTCGYRLNIPALHVLPKPHGLLCPPGPSGEIACSWGEAVNVKNQFVYVTQPENNRIIAIDVRTQLIIEVIPTDRIPVSLHYIPHLDTLWVVCWQSTDAEEGQRSIQVIKYVSQRETHTPIHTTPIGHHFDVVKGLFIPQVQIPNQGNYKFGYVVHSQQMAITKINLETTTLSSTIVLSQHQCYPDSVAFLATGGYVIVSCADGRESRPSKQLFLDYLTDTVLHVNEGIRGTPYTSPDGRYIISADNQHGLIYVQKVTLSGKVKSLFEVSTNLGVSDVGFFPTKASTHTYDIMVTSRDRPDVLFVDLETSKVKMIPGVFHPISAESWPWNEHNRHIVNSGVFGPHLATPAADHVVLIDGKKKSVQCDIDDVSQSNVIVWVGDCY
ncbi:follistatin-related protein 5-like isoform X2 [Patiria miniata]|nr:follistatin-related protein 5-like isoform X2 [Patiria miniata]XP_038061886.1 follistatin-related protein 5-like isoform X2 [Patiria miniata]XP_038061887.1 follistatin-related protein 5-like isoform X2 [Patiria miniata]